MKLLFSSLLVLTLFSSFGVCASDFVEKFPGGVRIVDGDIPVLFEVARRDKKSTQLIIDVLDDGMFDVLDKNTAMNLTYCVSDEFGDNKESVIEALAVATQDWMSSANVHYLYLPQHDQNCDQYNKNVLFDVRPINEGGYLARAFFPNFPRISRNIIIDLSSFAYPQKTLNGILRHELGHTLGFRHEHIHQDNQSGCNEDKQFEPLTPYDRKSVMHYPQCGGLNDIDELVLTNLDRSGAQKIYSFK
jgi:hypothetical protein